MDIRKLGRSLSNKIMQNQREMRDQQIGIRPLSSGPVTNNDISHLIRTIIMEPLARILRETNGQNMTFHSGTSIGFYYLFVDDKNLQ